MSNQILNLINKIDVSRWRGAHIGDLETIIEAINLLDTKLDTAIAEREVLFTACKAALAEHYENVSYSSGVCDKLEAAVAKATLGYDPAAKTKNSK